MQYFIGQFDGETFTSENPKNTMLWADFGADYYAAQSWSDEPNGRRLMIGWLNNWQYAKVIPTAPWRGVCSLPRELSLKQTENGVRLFQQPIPELIELRGAHWHWHDVTLTPGADLPTNLRGDSLEIVAKFLVNPTVDRFGFRVQIGNGEHTTIGYETKNQILLVDRTQSGQADFSPHFSAVHTAKMQPINDVVLLHIFVDRSSVEVFGNNGSVVMTEQIFPAPASLGVETFADGGQVILKSLDVYQLDAAHFRGNTIEPTSEGQPALKA